MDNEEFDLGMRCLAVPIFDSVNETIAAIAVTGTALEIHDRSVESLIKSLRAAATSIGKAIGTLTDANWIEADLDTPSRLEYKNQPQEPSHHH